ncbi:D-alanine--D-alanine ligase family protein [Viscerimonas tarda]
MDGIKHYINNFIQEHKYLLQGIRIILIANVISQTKHKETRSFNNIAIEFFTEEEIDEIIQGLRNNGLYVDVYFDEHCFIDDVINNNIKDIHNILIFNLTRNGFGIGKKALIPSFCDLFNIKYTGSNAYATSLARHKYHYSKLLSALNLCGTPSWLFDKGNWFMETPPKELQIILKPTFESASKGINIQSIMNTSQNDFFEKISEYQKRYNQPIICQEFISGYEVEVPIIETYSSLLAFPPTGIKINNNMFIGDSIISEEISSSYGYDFYLAQNVFDKKFIETLLDIAKKSFKCIGLSNYGRIDFRISKDQKVYVTDISATPYVISHSSFNYVFQQLGFEQKDIFLLIVLSALVNKSIM